MGAALQHTTVVTQASDKSQYAALLGAAYGREISARLDGNKVLIGAPLGEVEGEADLVDAEVTVVEHQVIGAGTPWSGR